MLPYLDLSFFSQHRQGPLMCTEPHLDYLLLCQTLLWLLEFDLLYSNDINANMTEGKETLVYVESGHVLILFGSFKLTLHQGTIGMEKTDDGNIGEFPLSSFCSVYSVIEVLFIAIAPDQRLWNNTEKVLRLYEFKDGDVS